MEKKKYISRYKSVEKVNIDILIDLINIIMTVINDGSIAKKGRKKFIQVEKMSKKSFSFTFSRSISFG